MSDGSGSCIYAVASYAVRTEPHSVSEDQLFVQETAILAAGMVSADTPGEAEARTVQNLLERYPVVEGWSGHRAAVSRIGVATVLGDQVSPRATVMLVNSAAKM